MMGIDVFLDEAITIRTPPTRKIWETFGTPKLLVVGHYQMGFEIAPNTRGSRLRVFIDYELPQGAVTKWIGHTVGAYYARWCTHQMLNDAVAHFAGKTAPGDHPAGRHIAA